VKKEEFIEYCKQHIGKPYIWGADGPDSFDCSGLAQALLAWVGLDPPGDQTANGLYRHFKIPDNGVPVAIAECGCLVFYGKPSRVGHVAVCLDDKDMIEAGGGGPETTTIEIAVQHKAEVRTRPINRRSDLVALIRPRHLPWAESFLSLSARPLAAHTAISNMLYNTIDISHWETVESFEDVKKEGIVLVIHKATQGFKYVDKKYKEHMKGFKEIGLAWGSYHFGIGGDGSDQADHFLSEADPDGLLVLDLEGNSQGKSMTIEEAEEFVRYIRDVTGRYPGLYSGYTIRELMGNRTDTPLAKCWLWTARYGNAPVFPKAWNKWTFWQYTDGKAGTEPHRVKGIGECDRNVFNGDETQFEEFLTSNTKSFL
jgi:lysozyme